jgi:hypothetical protein
MSNYATDLFSPIFDEIQKVTGAREYTDKVRQNSSSSACSHTAAAAAKQQRRHRQQRQHRQCTAPQQ